MDTSFNWSPPEFPPLYGEGVKPCSVVQIIQAPEFPELVEEYAAESAIAGMPTPAAKLERYRALDDAGLIHAFVAMKADRMVGFITMLAPPSLHFEVPLAVCESFFVASAHRKGGAGLRLLKEIEDRARTLRSPGLLVCAPVGGRLFEVLERRGYRETNRVFHKRLFDA